MAEERMVRDLKTVQSVSENDKLVGETRSGTSLLPLSAVANAIFRMHVFETKEVMQKAKLEVGDVVFTLGYHKANDGAGGMYIINHEPAVIPNNGTIIGLTSNTALRARLELQGDSVSVTQFGAYGDGVHDDTVAIQNAINSGSSVTFGGTDKKYKITAPIKIKKGINIESFYASVYPYNCEAFIIEDDVCGVHIDALNIKCGNNGNGIKLSGNNGNIDISNTSISDFKGNKTALNIINPDNVLLENISINAEAITETAVTEAVRIYYDNNGKSDDTRVKIINIDTSNCQKALFVWNYSESAGMRSVDVDGISFNSKMEFSEGIVVGSSFRRSDKFINVNVKNVVAANVTTVLDVDSFVYGAVCVDGVLATDTKGGYSLANTLDTTVCLKGLHRYIGSDVEYEVDYYPLFTAINGTLIMDAQFEINRHRYRGIKDPERIIGKVKDGRSAINGEDIICNYETTKILCDIPVNACYNWIGPLVLSEIIGCDGQVVAIKSTTGQEIMNSGNIVLFPDDPEYLVKKPLPKDSYYIFKCHKDKWIRIMMED